MPDAETSQALRPLRVLTVTPVGIDGKGGIDRLNGYFEQWRKESAQKIQCIYLGSRGDGGSLVWPFHFLSALSKFVGLLASRKFDVVHIHVSTDGSALRKYFFGKIAGVFNTPYVIHYHGMMSDEIAAANPLWLRVLKSLAGNAERVIVLGQFFRPFFENSLGVDAGRICIVRNGTPDAGHDALIPRPASSPAHILFAGEVGERKGVDVLIDALAILQERCDSFQCTIAGNGNIEHWREYASQKGLESKLAFTGWVPSEKIQSLARKASIIILPSRAEALPLSLIEGASAGAALIATGIGAVSEVVHDGVNGVIVTRDSQEIAAVLKKLIDDTGRLQEMQKASREIYLSRFTVPVYGAAVVACLQAAADAKA